jgi:hypothetical protein
LRLGVSLAGESVILARRVTVRMIRARRFDMLTQTLRIARPALAVGGRAAGLADPHAGDALPGTTT